MSEADRQARILLAIGAEPDTRVFRNTVGFGWQGEATRLPDGSVLIRNPRPVTFGLAPGSPDIVGWQSCLVTAAMVGRRLARFVGIEVKDARGRASEGQNRFLGVLSSAGGACGIARTPAEARAILGKEPNPAETEPPPSRRHIRI